jgi:replicative DNA helicase
MGRLTERAERAVLGAMIIDPTLAAGLVQHCLEVGDFTSEQHRAVYAGILAASQTGGLVGPEWREAITQASGVSANDLDEMTRACPVPRHGAAYGAMVIQARVHREIAAHAARIARQASILNHDGRRLFKLDAAPGMEALEFAVHLDGLATAMRSHVASFDPPSAEPAPQHPYDAEQVDREESVLIALIQQHREAGQILGFLPDGAFTDPVRRTIFATVRGLTASERPVDELTVDWELASQWSQSGELPVESPASADRDSYVTRLAHAHIGRTSPLVAAGDLLTWHLGWTPGARAPSGDSARPTGTAPGSPPRATGQDLIRPQHIANPGSGPQPAL